MPPRAGAGGLELSQFSLATRLSHMSTLRPLIKFRNKTLEPWFYLNILTLSLQSWCPPVSPVMWSMGRGWEMCKKVIYSVFISSLLLVLDTGVESSAQHVTLPDGQSELYYHIIVIIITQTQTLLSHVVWSDQHHIGLAGSWQLVRKNHDFPSQLR